jgi:hypothetical protein
VRLMPIICRRGPARTTADVLGAPTPETGAAYRLRPTDPRPTKVLPTPPSWVASVTIENP